MERLALARVLIDLALALLFILLIPFIGRIQGIALCVLFIMGASNTAVGIVVARRGNVERGIFHVIATYFINALALVLIFEGLGVFALVALIAVTGMFSSSSLPRRKANVALIASVGVGLTAILMDLSIAGAAFRVQIPPVLTPLILILGTFMALSYGYTVFRDFANFPLRTKFIAAFSLVAILPLIVLGFLNERSTRSILTQEANEALFAAAQQTADSLQDFISTNLFAIRTEADLPSLIDFLTSTSSASEQALQTLNALQAKNSVFISSYAIISSSTGRIVLDTDTSRIGDNVTAEPYFREPLNTGQPYLSHVLILSEGEERALIFSSPIQNETGETIGVLSVRYNAEILQNLVARSNGLVGEDSFGVLFDENLIHLAHGVAPDTILTPVMPLSPDTLNMLIDSQRLPEASRESQALDFPAMASELESVKESPEGVSFFETEDIATGKRTNQAVALDLGNPPWILVFFQPQDVFLAPAQTQTRNTILLSIVIGSIVIGLAMAMAQLLAKPITSLRAVAMQVAEGDLQATAAVDTHDEIGDLATTFNSMTAQLGSLVSGLEGQVAARTQDLEQRALQLQAAAEVARDSTQESDIQELLARAVELISERFELYHVGIYLVDERGEYAVLQAASGDAGALMLESEHRIQVGSNNAVGYVTRMGQPRVASDEIETVTLTRHPLLPETKGQMVLPLNVGDRVLGSLDLHSRNTEDLQEETIAIYRIMADQLAVAIQKTDLLSEVGQTLRELETAYGRYTSEAWQSFLQNEQSRTGYRYRQMSIEPVDEANEDVNLAWQAGEIISRARESNGGQENTLAVPMKVRGQVVGVLNMRFNDENIPGETRAIIEDLAERLGLVLENARLLENAQQRAERERLATEISVRMRESLDVQTIMQNTAQEIRQSLNLSEVSIRLTQSPSQPNGHEREDEIPTEHSDEGKV